MADIKKLYLELITDYDPFTDINEHKKLELCEMLYNLEEIKKNDLEESDDYILINRFNTLIELFHVLGYNAYLNYQD